MRREVWYRDSTVGGKCSMRWFEAGWSLFSTAFYQSTTHTGIPVWEWPSDFQLPQESRIKRHSSSTKSFRSVQSGFSSTYTILSPTTGSEIPEPSSNSEELQTSSVQLLTINQHLQETIEDFRLVSVSEASNKQVN